MGELFNCHHCQNSKAGLHNNAWTNLAYQCKHHPSNDTDEWNNVIQMTHTFFSQVGVVCTGQTAIIVYQYIYLAWWACLTRYDCIQQFDSRLAGDTYLGIFMTTGFCLHGQILCANQGKDFAFTTFGEKIPQFYLCLGSFLFLNNVVIFMAYFPHKLCPLVLSFSLLWSLYRLIMHVCVCIICFINVPYLADLRYLGT